MLTRGMWHSVRATSASVTDVFWIKSPTFASPARLPRAPAWLRFCLCHIPSSCCGSAAAGFTPQDTSHSPDCAPRFSVRSSRKPASALGSPAGRRLRLCWSPLAVVRVRRCTSFQQAQQSDRSCKQLLRVLVPAPAWLFHSAQQEAASGSSRESDLGLPKTRDHCRD